jgi:endonuclease YncB( thermonuclease family)
LPVFPFRKITSGRRRVAGREKLRPLGLRDFALTAGMFLILGAFAVHFEGRAAHEIGGNARVADGDSLEIAGQRIRLIGIDAPELDQVCRKDGFDYACGRQARAALSELIAGRTVACSTRRKDRYGRYLSTCAAGDRNLNLAMVEAGWAVASGDYHEAESRARAAGRGVWAGEFDRPGDWRARRGMIGDDGGLFDAVLDRLRLLLDRS